MPQSADGPPPRAQAQRTEATRERAVNHIVAATQRPRNPLRGKAGIALRVGGVLGRYKMRKQIRAAGGWPSLLGRGKQGGQYDGATAEANSGPVKMSETFAAGTDRC